jgi:hypothetical protein
MPAVRKTRNKLYRRLNHRQVFTCVCLRAFCSIIMVLSRTKISSVLLLLEKTSSSSKFENVFLVLFVDSLFIIIIIITSRDRSIDRFIRSSSRSLSSSSLFFDRFYFQIISHHVHEKSEGERRLKSRCPVRPAKTISRCCTKRRRRKQRRRFARTKATTTRRRGDYSVHGSVAVSLAIRE